MKNLIVFDLDGTLTPSKLPLEPEMSATFCRLLASKPACVIGGGRPEQFLEQFVNRLSCGEKELSNLYLMPTSGAVFYKYSNSEWEKIYEYKLSDEEKNKITGAIAETLNVLHYSAPAVTYGEVIEDRGSQISFSALGQKAPLELKSQWDPDQKKRLPIVEKLKELLPEFDIKMGGTTTIDITQKGINKAFGVNQITKHLGISVADAVYVGDALYENGNDAIVKETGIETIQVSGPADTIRVINEFLKTNSNE